MSAGTPLAPVPEPADAVAPPTFDPCGPLPSGTTVLEASAGTGKTYAIAALATRYLAEGVVELDQLMMITFGRMASDELRDRVRERLARTERQLGARLAGLSSSDRPDEVSELLTTGPHHELLARRERLARALADFDAATIATTHEFCLRMLDGLGVLGDQPPDAVFVEHLGELTGEVAEDVFLGAYAAQADPPLPYAEAVELARRVVGAEHAELVPEPEQAGSENARRRVEFAQAVRAEVRARQRRTRLFSYDDMLSGLRDALSDPEHGEAAARRLRSLYRVVLVDEFQDTDPVQWQILQRAFAGHATLVLIGDPKQAIYAFRGADVYSYLDAVRHAERWTLSTNWRSDAGLVQALDALMGGAALGDREIVVRPVRAHHDRPRLVEAAASAPLRLRVIPPLADPEQRARVGDLRPEVVADLVADVTRLLASPTRLEMHGDPPRRIACSDIAVLVRRNERGEAIRDALRAAGVPAVMLGTSSVFATPVAREWQILLTALAEPRQTHARAAALTCFLGWDVHRLASADDDELTDLAQRIRSWSRVLAGRGVAALVEVMGRTGLSERLLRRLDGERVLTDLRHLGQVLHATMTAGRLGPSALLEWLRDRIAEAGRDDGQALGGMDAERRLETDAKAVQILTVHRSKGLQFPVVYLPEAWDQFVRTKDQGQVLRLHEPGADGTPRCVLDVGGALASGRRERLAREQSEDAGEELRLLYVGLTRAECQAVTWWADSHNTPASALHRFLSRTPAAAEVERSYPTGVDPVAAFAGRPGLAVELVEPRAPLPRTVPREPYGPLVARRFDRVLDLQWRRTSYSSLTAAAHGVPVLLEAGVSSEPEAVATDDEQLSDGQRGPEQRGPEQRGPEQRGPEQPPADAKPNAPIEALSDPSPMRDLPVGADFGTLVHAVLETVDPVGAGPDTGALEAALRTAADQALTRTATSDVRADQLAEALLPTLRTPLGELAGHRSLADIPLADRLAELTFELPLAGGDTTSAQLHLGDLVPLLRRRLAPEDLLAGYPDLLAQPVLAEQSLRGYLTGSIDAVLRVGADDRLRYLVVDYKTNWLGTLGSADLRIGDYTPERMADAMMRAHYPLQALLYSVALHRMLRWRQPAYDPARHLGGVLYLFVRGMAGPQTPVVDGTPCGVFSWRPPAALITELSDLLDAGVAS